MLGKIKKITPSGYGFILGEDDVEYFFHLKQYDGDWDTLRKISPPKTKVGPVVQFQIFKHERGMRAERVVMLGVL